jgi:hypothetical protein
MLALVWARAIPAQTPKAKNEHSTNENPARTLASISTVGLVA